MNVYYLPNWDGVNECMVAARNQKEACKAMRTSVYSFHNYGGRRIDADSDDGQIALSEPGKVWQRKMAEWPRGPWCLTGYEVAKNLAGEDDQ